MRKLFFPLIIIFVFTGCAVQKPIEWSAIGGSRSDATVKLAYNYKYGTPNPDINQAIHLAKSRCASWGYASAELFGGESKVCNGEVKPFLGESTCTGEWTVTKEFQCTGEGNASTTKASENATAPEYTEEQAPPKKHKKRKH